MLVTRSQLAAAVDLSLKQVDVHRLKGTFRPVTEKPLRFDLEECQKAYTEFRSQFDATDDSSDELKESQLRRWIARIDLSSQKLEKLLETTIPADTAERLYTEAKRIVSRRLTAWASEVVDRLQGLEDRVDLYDVVNDSCLNLIDEVGELLACIDLSSQNEGQEDYGTLDLESCDGWRQKIDRCKARLNHIESDRIEARTGIVAGRLLIFDEVVRIMGDRHSAVRSRILALPSELAQLLVAVDRDTQLERLREKIADALENLCPFDVEDFKSKGIDYVRSTEETDQIEMVS